MSSDRIYVRHLRQAGFCHRGARQFFFNHNLDWSSFVKNGIPINKVEAIDDIMVRQVIRLAKGGR